MKYLKLILVFILSTTLLSCDKVDFKYEKVSEDLKLNFEINSKHFLIYDVNNDSILISNLSDEIFYPASLTKLVTLDTLLHLENDLDNNYSSYTHEQFDELIEMNASIAGLGYNKDYSLNELIYALILPSGADAAKCIENYFESKGLNLVEEMNKLCVNLSMNNSNFTNSTGLHDDNLYTTLDDYLLIIKDLLNFDKAKEVLTTMEYTLHDDLVVESTLWALKDNQNVEVLGGKTGYTGEAGRCLCVYYKYDNNYYILLLSSAYNEGYGHIEDAISIFELLYN